MADPVTSIINSVTKTWGDVLDTMNGYFEDVETPDPDDELQGVRQHEKHLQYPLVNDHGYQGILVFQQLRESNTNVEPATLRIHQQVDVPVWEGEGSEVERDTVKPDATAIADQTGSANEPIKTEARKKYGPRVTMYLPAQLNISDQVTFGPTVLERSGEVARTAVARGGGLSSSLGKMIIDEVGTTFGAMLNGAATPAAKLAALSNAKRIPFVDDAVYNGFRAGAHITLNPNTRALLESVPLRNFDFGFKMIAKSHLEAIEIKKIIKYFRSRLLPGSESVLGIGAYFTFPDVFDIQILYIRKNLQTGVPEPMEVATKIKECYLTNVDVVYNAGSMGMHDDGNFSEIDMSLKFMEVVPLRKSDIAKGY